MQPELFIKITIVIGGLMTAAAYFVLLERRIAAWVQDRVGPNRVGIPLTRIRLFGLGQPLADGLKMIFKEEYTPRQVDRRLYVLAPLLILTAALSVFAVIPFGSAVNAGGYSIELSIIPGLNVGLIYIFALSSIAVYGVILGGWASNSKYSFLGGLRSSAQLIAYELPLGLGILGIILASSSLDLETIMAHQAESGWWYAFTQPLGCLVFVIAAFAEAARLPFDLPECEQELIGGYHTEYAGIKLLLFLVAEFIHMITASFLIVILFLGGWHFWGITGTDPVATSWGMALLRVLVLFTKVFLVIVFFMLVRWSWPRFRFDQLMGLAWKVMLPLGLLNFVVVSILLETRLLLYGQDASSTGFDITSVLISWLICVGSWIAICQWGPRVADNSPRKSLDPQLIDSQI
ncbi:MAG: NADH-quinone oxidoreductase subunit NuoH [Planctomycetaceae bacterium]|nr:NADH-quinone oxidoreductase subunit NuoH [Planctomycetaceae bacterium]